MYIQTFSFADELIITLSQKVNDFLKVFAFSS